MAVFCFTDIEGSTEKWEKHPDDMVLVIASHYKILDELVPKFGGEIIKKTGDGIFAIFRHGEPLQFAVEAQKAFQAEQWPKVGELRVRMAFHAGLAEEMAGDFYGPVANRTARLMSAAWGGQILVSAEMKSFTKLPPGASWQDLGIHLLKDLSEPLQIFGMIHEAFALKQFPALRSLSSRPNNLPIQATPFLGREEELAEIKKLFADPQCRLLTLLGPGGMGKTRLSLQAAAEQIENFVQGVYFIPLAALNDPALLESVIAETLKFTFHGRSDMDPMDGMETGVEQDQKAQLLNYLREKNMLLVMDNFEHLVARSGLVAEILASAPKIRVLATSRERLNLNGEWVFDVGGMKVPEKELPKGILSYSALDLFEQGARRVKPDFKIGPEERPHVVRICQLVEGMPLGIELASSWTRILSCREIAEEIVTNRDFLETTLRDVPERQRSLRAVFEYSWKLLIPAEQTAFCKMSVFRGACTRDAAAAVAGATLPMLSALVDKSLLRRTPEGRYEIHELLRQQAEQKLKTDPLQDKKARDDHATFYARYMKAREKAMLQNPKTFIEDIDREIENVRLAWDWATRQGMEEETEHLMEGFQEYLNIRHLPLEGVRSHTQAAQIWGSEARSERILGKLMMSHGSFLYAMGNTAEPLSLFKRSVEIFRRLGAERELAGALISQGEGSDFEECQSLYREGLEIARRLGDQRNIVRALRRIVRISALQGKQAEAKQFYLECIALSKARGAINEEAETLFIWGISRVESKEHELAASALEESAQLQLKCGNQVGFAGTNLWMAKNAQARGRYSEALRYLEVSGDIVRNTENLNYMALYLQATIELHRTFGEHIKASQLEEELSLVVRKSDNPEYIVNVITRLFWSARKHGGMNNTRAMLTEFLLRHKDEEEGTLFFARCTLSLSCLEMGDLEEARRHCLDNLERSNWKSDLKRTAWCHEILGEIDIKAGNFANASVHLDRSLKLNQQANNRDGEINGLALLAKASFLDDDVKAAHAFLTWTAGMAIKVSQFPLLRLALAMAGVLAREGQCVQAICLLLTCQRNSECTKTMKEGAESSLIELASLVSELEMAQARERGEKADLLALVQEFYSEVK